MCLPAMLGTFRKACWAIQQLANDGDDPPRSRIQGCRVDIRPALVEATGRTLYRFAADVFAADLVVAAVVVATPKGAERADDQSLAERRVPGERLLTGQRAQRMLQDKVGNVTLGVLRRAGRHHQTGKRKANLRPKMFADHSQPLEMRSASSSVDR